MLTIVISTLVNSGNQNGLTKYVQYLIRYLQETSNEHKFIILVNKDYDDCIKVWHPNFRKIVLNIPHHPKLIMRPIYLLWQNFFSKNFLRRNKVDVFHIPNPLPIFKLRGINQVVTVHDVAEYSFKRDSLFKQMFRIISLLTVVKKASQIITVSEFSKNQIVSFTGVEKEKVAITHLASSIDTELNPVPVEGIKKPFLIHVGGANRNKNIEKIIAAFERLERKDIELFFIGNTKNLTISKSEVNTLMRKGIHFMGIISEEKLLWFYKNALALIYPSIYEGFGLPILEAMTCGTAVITSNLASMPEIGGDAVHYVDPNNVDSIRSGIEKILSDKEYKKDLIRKGLNRVEQFDWEKTAKMTIKIYEQSVTSF